jgi:hypothetical protein
MIIDTHVHLNSYENILKISFEERLKALFDTMTNNSIDHSFILSSYKVNRDRPSTAQILEITKKCDNIGVIAGLSIDNHTDNDYQNCRKWLKDSMIKGIKIYCGYEHYYPFDKKYQRVYDLCVEFGIPVLIHTGDTFSKKGKLRYSHPINIDEIAVDNPDLKIVMCHLGNPWIIDCQEILYKNSNVYADISGLLVGDVSFRSEKCLINKIMELIRYAGEPDYLLYGSDWPICNMESYISFVQKLKVSQSQMDLIMYKNAKKLFSV